MPDLYQVLGLVPGATQDQVKAAFHRLAKASHPDVNADDAMAEKRFKENQSCLRDFEQSGEPSGL